MHLGGERQCESYCKCLAQLHNEMIAARAHTRASQSGVHCANLKATLPPYLSHKQLLKPELHRFPFVLTAGHLDKVCQSLFTSTLKLGSLRQHC